MTFDEACTRLAALIQAHGTTALIVDGQPLLFEQRHTYTDAEVTQIASSLGIALPAAYRSLLVRVGAARLYIDDLGRGIDIVPLEDLREFSKSVFENFGPDPFPALMLTVSLPRIGCFGGFARDVPAGQGDYAVFSPEDDPAEWIAESTFCPFEDWVIQVVESDGRRTLV